MDVKPVEGDPEIACRSALEALGADLDRRSISIFSVGGQAEIPVFAKLLAGLRIPGYRLSERKPSKSNLHHHPIENCTSCLPQTFCCNPNLETLWGLPRKPNRVEAMSAFPASCANLGNIPQVHTEPPALLGRLAP